jgi:hypothetical protein
MRRNDQNASIIEPEQGGSFSKREGRMKLQIAIAASILLLGSLAAAPITQPAPSALEVRANTAFNAGQYALALPLLQKVQASLKNQPERIAPIQEKIRVCKAQVAQAAKVNGASVYQILAAAAPVMDEIRKPHAPPQPGEVRDMKIRELGNFDYDADQGGNIPADVKALSGMNVRLKGFMIPIDQAENITQFALVPSLFACCFGQPPQIQHTVICQAPPGKAVAYDPDELCVEGRLKVEEKKDDGFIISIFEVDATSVKPAAK